MTMNDPCTLGWWYIPHFEERTVKAHPDSIRATRIVRSSCSAVDLPGNLWLSSLAPRYAHEPSPRQLAMLLPLTISPRDHHILAQIFILIQSILINLFLFLPDGFPHWLRSKHDLLEPYTLGRREICEWSCLHSIQVDCRHLIILAITAWLTSWGPRAQPTHLSPCPLLGRLH